MNSRLHNKLFLSSSFPLPIFWNSIFWQWSKIVFNRLHISFRKEWIITGRTKRKKKKGGKNGFEKEGREGRTRREERMDYKRKDEKEEQEGRIEWARWEWKVVHPWARGCQRWRRGMSIGPNTFDEDEWNLRWLDLLLTKNVMLSYIGEPHHLELIMI